jgi:hypothetical protein
MEEKMNIVRLGLSTTTICVALAGCGGGGGSANVVPTIPTYPFTSFTAAQALTLPATIQIGGVSQEATYTANLLNNTITSLTAPTAYSAGATYSETINAAGVTTAVNATSANGSSISFNAANGDILNGYLIYFPVISATVNAAGSAYILSPNRGALGVPWNYQSFGVWVTGGGTGAGTVGVMSAGAETLGASMPNAGTFIFLGVAGGKYADTAGNPFNVFSDMAATVDFGLRTISFRTMGSVVSADLITSALNSNLDITGSLTYTAGTNQFTGAATTLGGGLANAPMSGTVTGRFYGPTATEIGGTFALSGANSTNGYIGAFGGIR